VAKMVEAIYGNGDLKEEEKVGVIIAVLWEDIEWRCSLTRTCLHHLARTSEKSNRASWESGIWWNIL